MGNLSFVVWGIFLIMAAGPSSALDCGRVIVNCNCGNFENQTYVPVEIKESTTVVDGKVFCTGVYDVSEECAKISCDPTSNNTGLTKRGKTFLDNFFPKLIEIPPAGDSGGDRVKRNSEYCHINPMQKGTLKCLVYLTWVDCEFICNYGYGVKTENGEMASSTRFICENDTWTPELHDCKPLFNCRVHLVNAGTIFCDEPETEPAFCDISCEDYYDDYAMKTGRYVCTDKNFGKSLPSCAELE